tara:strand:- start:16980 stop:17261 length:282 start_codon:yes stop_codon:yes gene_type:complete
MGSLTSTPKVPQTQSAAPPVSSTPITSPPITSPTTTISSPDQSASARAAQESEERTQSLLARGRGRLGTIATSFQGFLREVDQSDARKTLLGE